MTVIVQEPYLRVILSVNVKIAVPAFTPVTVPFDVTVKTDELFDDQIDQLFEKTEFDGVLFGRISFCCLGAR